MAGKLISTRDRRHQEISYTDALLRGLAPDKGLYVPTEYPQIQHRELRQLKKLPYPQIAFQIKKKFVAGTIPDEILERLLLQAYSSEKFPDAKNGNIVPVMRIEGQLYLQNLSLGPTAAFKDMALQPLGQEMNYELNKRNEKLVILGATSGDTGSSAEAAMKGLERIMLFMLSPQGGMSDFQKAQMGNLSGGNIFNISVNGRFDDCQNLVKQLKYGAVNSINWARIASQVPYYVAGYLQVANKIGDPVDFVIPTGNFGNVLAGYIAKRMGLPIRNLIIATNENNVLERLVHTGIYEKTPAQITSSPSMDIQVSSNFERVAFDLFGGNPRLTAEFMNQFEKTGRADLRDFGVDKSHLPDWGFRAGSSTHTDRLAAIKEVYENSQIVIDPHTADGVTVALRSYNPAEGVPMVVMQTALAVKFEATIKEALGFIPTRDKRFVGIEERVEPCSFHLMEPNVEKLDSYIQQQLN